MLRRHPVPPQTNFEPLIKAVRHQGFDIGTTSGKQLAVSLDSIVKEEDISEIKNLLYTQPPLEYDLIE
jgi:exosome complex exonuclease DIS3/RRP44